MAGKDIAACKLYPWIKQPLRLRDLDDGDSVSDVLTLRKQRLSQHLTTKPAVEDLEEKSIEDVQRSLQSTLEGVFKRYKKKDEQFSNIEVQLKTAKEEIKQVTKEKNKVSDDYQKTAKELKNTKQKLQQKIDQLRDLETKFDQLEAKLQNLASERNEKCKELDGLKKVLQGKEIAFKTFIREFNGKEQSCGQGKMSCDVDGSSYCSICMEPWTESGEHNICSLSCGHFFGRSCITKWITQATRGLSTCPQCLKSASLGDLRQHYVQRICIGDEKKIDADDGNNSQRGQPLIVSRIVQSSVIESAQNDDMTNEEYEGVQDVGPSGAGGDSSGEGDDGDDNDESDPAGMHDDDDVDDYYEDY